MSALSHCTSTALFSLSALLFSTFAAAQPAVESTQASPMQPEAATPPAPPPTAPAAEASRAPEVASVPPASSQPNVAAPNAVSAPPSSTTQPEANADDAPQTLFRSGAKVGGYGGLDVAYTRLAGKDAALVCLEGALLLDHSFSLGLVGCGNASRLSGQSYGNVPHESGDRLEFGYGGLVVGYQFFPKKLYNLSLTAMVGGGGAAIVNYRDTAWDNDNLDNHRHLKTHDALFVAEPRLTGYLNLTRWARVGAFAGYRFVGGVDMTNLSSSDLSGPVAGGTLQFGWF